MDSDHEQLRAEVAGATRMAAFATRRANEALQRATEARDGARLAYEEIGGLAKEVARLTNADRELAHEVREMRRDLDAIRDLVSARDTLPPPRDRHPSGADLAADITGTHHIPSSQPPAEAIVRTGLALVFSKVTAQTTKAIVIGVAVAALSAAAGWLVRDCTAHGASVIHQQGK